MQLHDCNAFLVGMSACFLGRHSSLIRSNVDVRLDAFRSAKVFPIQRFGMKAPSILRIFPLKRNGGHSSYAMARLHNTPNKLKYCAMPRERREAAQRL